MCARFKWALGGPDRWDKMTAAEWDGVPQPIRGIAILRMIEHWQPYLQAVTRRETNYLRGGAARPTWTWLRKNAPPAPPEAVPPPTTLLVSDAQP